MVFLIVSANRIIVYEAYTSEYFNRYVDKNKLVGILTTNFILLIVFGAFTIAGVIFAIYFAGKYGRKGRVQLNLLDRIFPELRILGIFIMGVGVATSEEIDFQSRNSPSKVICCWVDSIRPLNQSGYKDSARLR